MTADAEVARGRGQRAECELAVDAVGRFLALRTRVAADAGAYLYPPTTVPPVLTGSPLTGPYQVPAARVGVLGVATNKVPTGPYRGAGRPEGACFCDPAAEQAAAELGIDRAEIRRRNLIPPAALPYRTPTGTTIEPAGLGFTESATVTAGPDGRVIAQAGTCSHGQGHQTAFARLLADALDLDLDLVEVRFGDTASAPPGTGTFASRSAIVGGSALVSAAADFRHQVIARAAATRGVAEDQVLAELAAGPSPAPRSSDPRPAGGPGGG